MSTVADVVWKEIFPRTPVFTTAEVAELAMRDISGVSVSLSKLADQGRITRVRRGLWAVSDHPTSPHSRSFPISSKRKTPATFRSSPLSVNTG